MTASLMSVLLLLVVIGNILFFFMAIHERFLGKKKKICWVCNSQVLTPEKPNEKPSVVLVHGFVGSPFDFKELGLGLKASGFRVVIPCMPGQGRSDFAYLRGRFNPNFYVRWLQNILENEYKKTGSKPYLVGFSMGGALSCMMASRSLADRLVLIAPFFDLPQRGLSLFVYLFGYLFPVIPKTEKGKINDTNAKLSYLPGSMLISIPAFRNLKQLSRQAESSVDNIKGPVLVMCSRNDRVASY
jgi:carboxylesterase